MYVSALADGNEEIESLQERITGRAIREYYSKDKDGNVLVKAKPHDHTAPRGTRYEKGVDENGASH